MSSERFPEDVSRALDAFFIGVGIQPKGGAFICVAQLFGNGGNVCSVCHGHTGEAMTQLVGMHVLYSIADGKLPHVVCADGDIKASQIIVTPNLGDSYSSPIQYKNYQKTFILEEHLVNEEKNKDTELEERVEAYLVCFAEYFADSQETPTWMQLTNATVQYAPAIMPEKSLPQLVKRMH